MFYPQQVVCPFACLTAGAHEPTRSLRDTDALLVFIMVFSSSLPFLFLGQHADTDPGALFCVLRPLLCIVSCISGIPTCLSYVEAHLVPTHVTALERRLEPCPLPQPAGVPRS